MTHQTLLTTSAPASGHPLLLQALAGPPLGTIRIETSTPVVLGRASDSDVRLDSDIVSKRHAAVSRLGEGWVVRDLGSRHGTFLNGVRLTPHEAVPVSDGDLLTLKPWVFQLRTSPIDAARTMAVEEPADEGEGAGSISAAPASSAGIAHQYAELISASGAIYGAATIGELAAAILDRALAATGFHRAAVLRQCGGVQGRGVDQSVWHAAAAAGSGGDRAAAGPGAASIDPGSSGECAPDAEVLASAPDPPGAFEFSRSLIRAASSGTPALMIAPPGAMGEGSVVRLRITRALCLPILVEGTVWGYLYLDSRRGETAPRDDAVAFGGALVEMAGLAVANIKGRELRRRLADLQSDIEAAAHVQQLIMPPSEGRFGAISYAVRSRPGRLLSGDLFDVVELDRGRTAVMLGDVAGKGVGAAFIMAVAQTLVRSLLSRCDDPAAVLDELNAYLADLQAGARFISLWLGIIDPELQTLTAADGGHGYCVIVGPGTPAAKLQCAGGPVLGADAACRYASSVHPWPPSSRIVLFSDGVVEQCGSRGDLFGLARVLESLSPSAPPVQDVQSLFAALERFAGTPAFTDDVTIASVGLGAMLR